MSELIHVEKSDILYEAI